MATKKVILKEIVNGVAGDSIHPETSIDMVEGLESALAEAGSVSTISVNSGTPLTPDANKNIDITIPSTVTESTVIGWGFTKNAGTITGITMNGASKGTSGVVDLGTVATDISGKEDKSNKVTSFSSPTDEQYPSAKLVNDQLATKQNTISDIASIRSGATAGSTAIQSVTVGTTTTGAAGTNASVTNSGNATAPVLDFTIPQGVQGVKGDTVIMGNEDTYTLYNVTGNAVDGAMTQQAVTRELTTLSDIVNGTPAAYVTVNYDRTQVVTGSIASNGKWQTSNESIFIPIVPGNTYKVNGESAGTHISVLRDSTHTENVLMHYSTGYSGRVDVTSGTTNEFTAPDNGYYLYVLLKSSAGDLYPTVYEMSHATEGLITLPSKVEDVESAVDNMESEVAKQTLVLFGDEPRNKKGELSQIDLSQYSAVVGLIDGEGLWINNGKSKLIPMTDISAVRVYGGTTGQIFSFLKDTTLVVGSAAHFATGYSGRNTVLAGEIIDYEVPDDCNYICTMVETTGGAARTPEIYMLYYYGEGSISEQIGELRTSLSGTKTYVQDADMNKQSIYISSEGEVLSGYSSSCISVSEYKQVFLNDTTTIYTLFYSFLKEAIELGVTPSFASGYTGLKSISAGQSVTVDIPEDAEYLYVSINYTTYPTVILSNPSFEEQLSEIKGKTSALSGITVPLNYNEEGDGTSGIAPALNARTEGGKVVIPKGIYNITQQIVIPSRNLNIEGAVWNYPQDPNGVHPSDTGTKLSLVSNQIESVFKTQSDMSGMRMSQIGFQGLATTWDYDDADENIAEYYFNPSSIKNVGLYIGNGRFDQVSLHRLSFSGLAVGILAKYTIDANVWSEINTDGCDFGIFVDYTTCHHPKILNNITSDCVAAGIYYKTTIGQNSYGAVIDGNVLVRNASYLTAAQIAANIPQASLVLIGHSYASVSNNTIILSGIYKRKVGGENYTAYSGGIGLYFTGNYNAIRGNRIAWSTQKAAYINGNYNSITNNIVDDDHDGFEVVGNYNVISDNVFDSALTVTGNNNKVEGNVYTGNIVVSGNNNVISGDKAAVITVSGSGNKLIGFSSANITDNGTNTVIE